MKECPHCKQLIGDNVVGKCPLCYKEIGNVKIVDNNKTIYRLHGVNGQISVYEDRIVISRKGVIGFLSQGAAGDKTIPIKSIHTVQYKEGNAFVNGFIQFGVSGGREKQGGRFEATKDENSVMFTADNNYLVMEIKEFIEGKIVGTIKPISQLVTQPIVKSSSVVEELKQFKELLDLGIITQEEFDAKKKKILDL